MNGGTIIANIIRQYGVTHLFTLSGGHIAPIYVEAEKAGLSIIDVRHEATAVFAADALARMSGIIGVATVTAGPGVTNTITALKNAQMAESPLLLIGGAAATLLKNRGALQDIDQMALVRPHVKYAARVTKLKDLAPKIHEAVSIATNGVPGPVFIECPMDLLYEEELVRDLYYKSLSKGNSLPAKLRNWYIKRHVNRLFSGISGDIPHRKKPKIDSSRTVKDISRTIAIISASERPLIVAGSGAMKQVDRISELAPALESLGIPVYLGGMARGLLGRNSRVQYFHRRTKALKEADCIILAGIPVDFRLNYGGHFNRAAQLIAISKNRTDLRKNLKADIAIQEDPARYLTNLSRNIPTASGQWNSWHEILHSREQDRELEITNKSRQKTKYINPLQLLRSLEEKLPHNSVIIVDGGDFAASAAYMLRPRGPLKWLDPGVFGTLGSGGGFALGAALHYPDHYIWIIYGDGSAGYSLMEFDTFNKFGIKVCGIVGNNGSWEQIARDQEHILASNTASTLPRSDYEKVAEAFGANGIRVESMESFDLAVKNALASMDKGVPYLINAIIGTTDFRKGSISM